MKNSIARSLVLKLAFGLYMMGIASAQTYSDWSSKAQAEMSSNNHNSALAAFTNAFHIHQALPEDLYNAACAASLTGKKDQAIAYLETSIRQGYIDTTHLASDPDLESLHDDAQWPDILKLASQKNKSVNRHPLKAELEEIREKDQSQRMLLLHKKPTDSLIKAIQKQDMVNQHRVKEIIDKYGWLGPSEIGQVASSALFLVIQHADLADQKRYILLLKNAVEKGQARAEDFALMEDRIAIREGRKQRYGSQIGLDKASGTQYVFPLKDPDGLDDLRRSVGLIPMEDYMGMMNLHWDLASYKENEQLYERYHSEFLEQKGLKKD